MNLKVEEWIRRYLPANLFCTACILIVSYITFNATNDRVLTAFLSSITGTACYYGFILIRDVIKTIKKHRLESKKYSFISFSKNVRDMIVEFGFSEVADTFIVAPAFMYFFPLIIGDIVIGTFAAKFLSDVIFYTFAIIAYELRKKHLSD